MRKFAFNFLILFVLSAITFAQTNVVTTPQYKSVVLEEFTGIQCQYCPFGHEIGESIFASYPNQVVLVNIHSGIYADPGSTGGPDFRTIYGEAIDNEAGVTGYPAGQINRRIFSGTAQAMSRGDWASAAAQVVQEISPVNIAVSSSFNSTTRLLTVDVELYYREASTASSNFLNVALLENHVYGYQRHSTIGVIQNYDHKHIFRWFLTGQWGDEITTTTAGSVVTKQYTYTVPADWDIANCDVAAYVAESHSNVLQGVQVVADGGQTSGITQLVIGTIDANQYVVQGTVQQETSFDIDFCSLISGDEQFEVSLVASDLPSDWDYEYEVDGTAYNSAQTFTFTENQSETIKINVTPGSQSGMPKFSLTIKSVAFPNSPVKNIAVYVIANVKNLVVNCSGSWGSNNSYNYDSVYVNAFNQAGITNFAVIDGNIMVKGFDAQAFSTIKSIYYNNGFKFPPFSDEEVNHFMNFLDQNGSLFIAGQDIGWALSSSGGYGTAANLQFYSNYLSANYIADGTGSNNLYIANPNDPIFKNIPQSSIVDMYGGNIYPDQLTATSTGIPFFQYNSASPFRYGGIRSLNQNFKTVYLGVGLEMIQSFNTRVKLVSRTNKWFNGLIPSIIPIDGATNVPINNALIINLDVAARNTDDSPITSLDIENQLVILKDNNNNNVPFTAVINEDYTEIQITPVAPLSQTTTYTLSIAGIENYNDELFEEASSTFTTGIGSNINEINGNFRIYPNPFESKLNIELDNNRISDIKIYDVNGIMVYTSKGVTSNKIEINTSNLNPGVYYISINNSDKTSNQKVVLIR